MMTLMGMMLTESLQSKKVYNDCFKGVGLAVFTVVAITLLLVNLQPKAKDHSFYDDESIAIELRAQI